MLTRYATRPLHGAGGVVDQMPAESPHIGRQRAIVLDCKQVREYAIRGHI